MIIPLNNHCLVEVIDEYSGIHRTETDQQFQKGKLLDYGLTPDHLTTSTGYRLENIEAIKTALDQFKGKIVYWAQYADSGQVFTVDEKQYALIPFYRLIGVEE